MVYMILSFILFISFQFISSVKFKHAMIHSTPFFLSSQMLFPQHTKTFPKYIFSFFFSIIYVNLISRILGFSCALIFIVIFFDVIIVVSLSLCFSLCFSVSYFYNNNGNFLFIELNFVSHFILF